MRIFGVETYTSKRRMKKSLRPQYAGLKAGARWSGFLICPAQYPGSIRREFFSGSTPIVQPYTPGSLRDQRRLPA